VKKEFGKKMKLIMGEPTAFLDTQKVGRAPQVQGLNRGNRGGIRDRVTERQSSSTFRAQTKEGKGDTRHKLKKTAEMKKRSRQGPPIQE